MKHQLTENIGRNGMPLQAAIRYTCSCDSSWHKDITLSAFNIARAGRPWCVPRSAQKAFREHIRQAAIAKRLARNDLTGLTAVVTGDDYDSIAAKAKS